jgi:glycosyltransferase involved in cell wall biosynthesis
MSRPLVSMVVLSHNCPGLLERAHVSVSSQAYPNLEILVADNRSASSDQICGGGLRDFR